MITLFVTQWRRLPTPFRRVVNRLVARPRRAIALTVAHWRWKKGRPCAGPVVIAGMHSRSLGIGGGARLFASALAPREPTIDMLDLAPLLGLVPELSLAETSVEEAPKGGTLISHVNPSELMLLLERTYGDFLRGRRHVGYWAWETAECPAAWRIACDWVDEIWAPSRFTAAAIERLTSSVVVRTVPLPVFAMPRAIIDRRRFGWASDDLVVLTAFDARSTYARKNPVAALDAYCAAVPRPDGRSRFVCKISNGDAAPALTAALLGKLAEREDTQSFVELLDEQTMANMIISADVVISLHRAEGFGLLAAQAMWCGRPVITTGWSGVLDFASTESARLVDFTLIPICDSQNMYRDGVWADPDVGEAAQHLAELLNDEEARSALGLAARRHALDVFDPDRWRSRVHALLHDDFQTDEEIT